MTDPLSVAAGVTGFITFALHGIRVLLEDLDQIKQAPENVLALREELRSVQRSITSLSSISHNDWNSIDSNITAEAESVIESCGQTCETFRGRIEHWTRHSSGDKLSVLDRPHIGFFKSSEMKSMQGKLQAFKISIVCVASLATLHHSLKKSHGQETISAITTKEEEEALLARKQVEAQEADLSARIQELVISEDSAADLESARIQIRDEKKALDVSKVMIETLLSSLRDTTAIVKEDKSINVKFVGKNNGIQMGVNNGSMNNITFGSR